jgi:hypothetical protein
MFQEAARTSAKALVVVGNGDVEDRGQAMWLSLSLSVSLSLSLFDHSTERLREILAATRLASAAVAQCHSASASTHLHCTLSSATFSTLRHERASPARHAAVHQIPRFANATWEGENIPFILSPSPMHEATVVRSLPSPTWKTFNAHAGQVQSGWAPTSDPAKRKGGKGQ